MADGSYDSSITRAGTSALRREQVNKGFASKRPKTGNDHAPLNKMRARGGARRAR